MNDFVPGYIRKGMAHRRGVGIVHAFRTVLFDHRADETPLIMLHRSVSQYEHPYNIVFPAEE